MATIDWALYTEKAVGRGSPTFADVVNRPLREVLTMSGTDPDQNFPGFSLVGHTHAATDIVSGTLAAARGGTGLSSPTAGSLLVAAGALAMTLLAPPAAGQVVRSSGTAWTAAPIVTADVSDLTTAATGITKVGALSVGSLAAGFTAITDSFLATIATAGKVANSATTATNLNTPSAIVARDASGNFSAGVITASLTGAVTGNASTATKLAAAVNINGVAFDGSGPITVTAAAGTLTGTTLASNVVTSSITGLGTVTAGVWNATVVSPTYGGTGVNNGSATLTLGGNVTLAGAFTTTITVTANTSVTLPTTGTLVNSAVTTLSSLTTVGILAAPHMTSPVIDSGGLTITAGTASLQAVTATTVQGSGVAAFGTTTNAQVALFVGNGSLSGTTQRQIAATGAFTSAATAQGTAMYAALNTAAAAFTMATGAALYVDSPGIGAGSAVTTLYGIYVENQVGGGTNYALYTNGGRVRLGSLPTSSAGLASGCLWNNSGVVNVV